MNNANKILLGVCGLVLLFAAFAGLNATGFFAVQGNEIVKIGVILPLTGTSADAGNYVKEGLLLAQEEINFKSNKKIQLIFEDSSYQSEKSVSAINKLIFSDGVKYIIGEYGSSQTLAIAPIAEANKVILISPGSQADKISASGDYIFRTQVTTAQEAHYLAEFIASEARGGKIGILALNTDYGTSLISDMTKDLNQLGEKVSWTELYAGTETDFRTHLLKANSEGVKYLLLGANRKFGGLIVKQAKELGYDFKFYGTSVIEGQEFLDTAGSAADGLIFSSPFNPDSTEPNMQLFQKKFFSKYGVKSEMLSANGYDALTILYHCITTSVDSSNNVKTCLYSTKNWQGASGTITFDANGDVEKQFNMKTVKDGKFITYGAN